MADDWEVKREPREWFIDEAWADEDAWGRKYVRAYLSDASLTNVIRVREVID